MISYIKKKKVYNPSFLQSNMYFYIFHVGSCDFLCFEIFSYTGNLFQAYIRKLRSLFMVSMQMQKAKLWNATPYMVKAQ